MDMTAADMLYTLTMFLAGFIILFIMYYLMPTINTRHKNRKSKLIYSLFSALYFSLVLTLLFAVLPVALESSGAIVTIIAGAVIVFVAVILQIYIMRELVRRRVIQIGPKSRSGVKK